MDFCWSPSARRKISSSMMSDLLIRLANLSITNSKESQEREMAKEKQAVAVLYTSQPEGDTNKHQHHNLKRRLGPSLGSLYPMRLLKTTNANSLIYHLEDDPLKLSPRN